MDRGAWQVTVHGVARAGHDLVTKTPSTVLLIGSAKPLLLKHQVKWALKGDVRETQASSGQEVIGVSGRVNDACREHGAGRTWEGKVESAEGRTSSFHRAGDQKPKRASKIGEEGLEGKDQRKGKKEMFLLTSAFIMWKEETRTHVLFLSLCMEKDTPRKEKIPPKQTNVSGGRSGEKGEKYDTLNGNEGRWRRKGTRSNPAPAC